MVNNPVAHQPAFFSFVGSDGSVKNIADRVYSFVSHDDCSIGLEIETDNDDLLKTIVNSKAIEVGFRGSDGKVRKRTVTYRTYVYSPYMCFPEMPSLERVRFVDVEYGILTEMK